MFLACVLLGGCSKPGSVASDDASTRADLEDTGRVFLIGLDGADWDVLDPLIEQGRLPTLAELKARGVWGRLSTLKPILSPPIWTSIATGKTPEKHGVTWFMVDTDQPGKRIPVTSTVRKVKAFWNILSERNKSVGVIGWWATFPAEPVKGFIVADSLAYHNFGVSGQRIQSRIGKAHPPSLLDRLEEWSVRPQDIAFEQFAQLLPMSDGDYATLQSTKPNFEDPCSHLLSIVSTAETYARIGRRLIEERPTDVFAIYFEGIDSVSHLFMRFAPPKMETVRDVEFFRFSEVVDHYCEYQDRLLADLLSSVRPQDSLVIVSDHGFKIGAERPVEPPGINVATAHEWHAEDGILLAVGPAFGRPGEIVGASVLDITPTLLYLLGLPVASDMDGGVVLDLFKGTYLELNDIAKVSSYEDSGEAVAKAMELESSTTVAEAMEERLRALGYIAPENEEPATPELYINRARSFLEKGDADSALVEVKKAQALRPGLPAIQLLLADVLMRQRRLPEARDAVRRAVELGAVGPAVLYQLALLETNLGDLDPALEVIDKAIEIDPENVRLLVTKSDILARQGRWDDALVLIESAAGKAPDDNSVLYNKAVCLGQLGRSDEAKSIYEKIVRDKPEILAAQNNLASLYESEGNVEAAMGLLTKAVETLDQPSFELHFNLGVLQQKSGKRKEAISSFRKALEADPESLVARQQLAVCYTIDGRVDQALEEWRGLAQMRPDWVEPWFRMARIKTHSGEEDRAETLLRRAFQLDPNTVRNWLGQDSSWNQKEWVQKLMSEFNTVAGDGEDGSVPAASPVEKDEDQR